MTHPAIDSDTILVLVHQKTSTPGRIGELLEERGYRIDRRCACIGEDIPESVDGYAGVVVFGGPMSANDDGCSEGIRKELDFIPKVLDAGVPFFGICLGGQLLARVLGANVAPHADGHVEVGYYRVSPTDAGRHLFEHSEHFYQFHREGFEVPETATLLATGAESYPNQAFSYGNALGIQFHPEITRAMIDRWTMGGAHRMDCPGGQPRRAHLIGHRLFDAGIERWSRNALTWLGMPGAAAMADAAD